MKNQEQPMLTSEQAQQINYKNGAIQGYKDQISEQADKIADLRGQINVREGLLKEAQQQLDANQKEIDDLKAKAKGAEVTA